ncbi:hypothetical protein HOF56_01720 [Candidatus Peribacteria bacterium]|jgi:hypothetical protein|nr:hypothetical protein [Candidatus Peribacteria bacterium]MBT4021391.1 hypothetical protein [Candidatus Peribacteria bacterium]MBT4240563.1 hypothetical protein [Candidatus Peribacteria bacterium]MBT4474030.1 hypothetical protein [Candidatus Peribacteria bacterium]
MQEFNEQNNSEEDSGIGPVPSEETPEASSTDDTSVESPEVEANSTAPVEPEGVEEDLSNLSDAELEAMVPKSSKALLYSALAAAFVIVAGGAFWFLRGGIAPVEDNGYPPFPTLDLKIAGEAGGGLFARLIGTHVDGGEIHYFEPAEAGVGFTALTGAQSPTDPERHNIFDADQAGLSPEVAFGFPEESSGVAADGGVIFWIYEYAGDEEDLRDNQGASGRDLFHGNFWLSAAQREAAPQYDWLHNETPVDFAISAEKRYYVMTSADICVSTMDSDGDSLNDGCELEIGTDVTDADTDDDGVLDGEEGTYETDPLSEDTDGDGLLDGTEVGIDTAHADTDESVFVADTDTSTTTDPLAPDTDDDGLNDGEEDANADGNVDETETDPNVADTDEGGVSDGDEINTDGTDPLDPSDDVTGPTEDCSTSDDEDLDGAAGCYDDDCVSDTDNCDMFDTAVESYCENSIDDDDDGDTDCDDTDCESNSACEEEEEEVEVCDNEIDDDGDELTDCEDIDDCSGALCGANGMECSAGMCECSGGEISEATCDDGSDNDCDGLADCEDIDDCSDGVACGANGMECYMESCSCMGPNGEDPEVTCDDTEDNDCDGLADCDDSDCDSDPACTAPAEVCGDMLVIGDETCDDGKHCDDGNGTMVECSDVDDSMCGTGEVCAVQDGDGCDISCQVEVGFDCTNDDPDEDTIRTTCELLQPVLTEE